MCARQRDCYCSVRAGGSRGRVAVVRWLVWKLVAEEIASYSSGARIAVDRSESRMNGIDSGRRRRLMGPLRGMAVALVLCWQQAAMAEPAPAGEGARRSPAIESPEPPSLIFILLDATRADRFSAWGNRHPTSPHMDALARDGAIFLRHFANAHATRASMPQIMSGRYYHMNVLASFKPYGHPREYPFRESDPTAVLLPRLLQGRGYYLAGVSAHPWVVAESPFGRAFDHMEFLPAPPERGHVDAGKVIDRALSLWEARPRDRPTFLYIHLMDLHMPRWLPDGELRFIDPSISWKERFEDGSHALFGHHIRGWTLEDAHDFTEMDRVIFTAFYDTLLAYTDQQLGRLFAAVRAEDPALESVVVAIGADHGEELGGEGRTSHSSTLTDAIHHVPFILTGGGIRPGQSFRRHSANIDITPTIASLLGVDTAPGTFDGRPLVAGDGRLCDSCGRSAVHYTWVTYQAIRSHGHLLAVMPPGSPEAGCQGGRERLWRLRPGGRDEIAVDGDARPLAARLQRRLARRLDPKRQRFRSLEERRPSRSFSVPAPFWQVDGGGALTCPEIAEHTGDDAFDTPGWQYARSSFVVFRDGAESTLPVRVSAPDGVYQLEVGVVPFPRPPMLFGRNRWLRKHFRRMGPESFVRLGTARARNGEVAIEIPGSIGFRQRLVSLRLTPQEAAQGKAPDAETMDKDNRERLRALGYIRD
jgi:arylsulfatase A-like enzyme